MRLAFRHRLFNKQGAAEWHRARPSSSSPFALPSSLESINKKRSEPSPTFPPFSLFD